MSKGKIVLLSILLLLLVNYSAHPQDPGGWFGVRMRNLVDVDKTIDLTDEDIYVYDSLLDLFIPQSIYTTGAAPNDADYLVGTADDDLSAEIVVGTIPGGELGGTWATPTIDTIHSGSAHHSAVTDATISMSDIATNNVSTSKHGFTPKLSNIATQFLNGQGAYSTPAGIAAAYVSQAFSSQTSINVSHAFGAYPDVQVIDGSGEFLIPLTITHNSINDFTVAFSDARSGNIQATLGAPQLNSYVNTGVNYTMVAADYLIEETGADTTVTLLTVVGRSGKIIVVKNTSSGDITIAAAGGETIDDDASIVISSFTGIQLFADGSSVWHII